MDAAIRCEFQTSRVRIQTLSDTGTVRACPTPPGVPLLIERIRDVGDKRRNVLSLTSEGRSELNGLRRKVASVDQVLTEDLDPAQISTLRAILTAMVDSPSVRARSSGLLPGSDGWDRGGEMLRARGGPR